LKNELITALYCRTALACDKSIAIQEASLRQYAEENDYGNVSVYTDNRLFCKQHTHCEIGLCVTQFPEGGRSKVYSVASQKELVINA